MRMQGITLAEGTAIANLSVPMGLEFPNLPNTGELFYLLGENFGLYVYTENNQWEKIVTTSMPTELVAPVLIDFEQPNGTPTKLQVNGGVSLKDLYLDQSSKIWTSVNNGEGQSGWRDIVADINVKSTGSANPAWVNIFGGLYAWRFSGTSMNEVFINFHLNHDYAIGTPIFLHFHWLQLENGNSGNVRWGFEYSVAKGHGQEPFSVPTIVYAEQQVSPIARTHMITEIPNGISSSSFEPDSIIMIRIFRDGVSDSNNNFAYGLTADIHYQANTFATKNRSPNFYE